MVFIQVWFFVFRVLFVFRCFNSVFRCLFVFSKFNFVCGESIGFLFFGLCCWVIFLVMFNGIGVLLLICGFFCWFWLLLFEVELLFVVWFFGVWLWCFFRCLWLCVFWFNFLCVLWCCLLKVLLCGVEVGFFMMLDF